MLAEAEKKGKLVRHDEEISYVRFKAGIRFVPRGTVILKSGTIIWGFPHIPRIFILGNGIKRNISSEYLYAEEKIDGFNLRIAQIEKKLFAFSRGGFVDQFSTEKVRGLGLDGFFEENPAYVLCGEMIGNTPYTPPTKDFDVRLLVFDIDRGDGSYLPPKEKYALFRKHRIIGVPQIGRFRSDDERSLRNAALALLKGKKEGMVIKSEDRSEVVKYVTPWADIDDIARNIKLMFDMPSGFFIQRILRSAMFIKDFGLDKKKYEREMGKAIYSVLIEKLKQVENGYPVSEEFEISIKDPAVWDNICSHTSKDVRLEVLSKRKEGENTRITFRKIYRKTDKRFRECLNGKRIID